MDRQTLGKELPSVTYRITEYFGRLQREGRSIVPTDSLSHVLYGMERCNVCKASKWFNCSTSCTSTHWNDSLVRMRVEATAMLSPQAQAHCWLWSPNENSMCSRLFTPPRVSQLMYYNDLVRAAIDEHLLSLTLQKPLVFLGDSLAEQMFVAAQCQAARTGRIPGRIRFIPTQNFNDRRFHRSRQGRAFERMRIVTMRGVLNKLSQFGGGTIAACVGIHYNSVAINQMAQAAGVKEGTKQLDRTDFQDDIVCSLNYWEILQLRAPDATLLLSRLHHSTFRQLTVLSHPELRKMETVAGRALVQGACASVPMVQSMARMQTAGAVRMCLKDIRKPVTSPLSHGTFSLEIGGTRMAACRKSTGEIILYELGTAS